MEIRFLSESDAQACCRLRFEALTEEPLAFGRAAEEHESVEIWEARFRDTAGGNFTLGAFQLGTLVGMVTFVRQTGLKERHKGHIYGVYVTSAQRRKRVGQALVAALLEKATKDASLEQILLAVGTRQTAAKLLYRSFGFESYGTEPKALKIGATYVDEDHMILRLR